MSGFSKNLMIILFLLGIVLPFNNCSSPETSVFIADSGSQLNQLSVVFSTPATIFIDPNAQIFTLSGLCNSTSYPDNDIVWTIETLAGQEILRSSQAGGAQFIAHCINGQFALDVRVPCPGLTNTGSGCFGLTQSYILKAHIYGINADGTYPSGAYAASRGITISP